MKQYHILDLPFGYNVTGAQWRKDLKATVYVGDLPASLKEYKPLPFTYKAFLEDELNGRAQALRASAQQYQLKDHQREGAKKIVGSYRAGSAGFLLADKTGVGKTLTALAGIATCARSQMLDRKAKVLIVCPKDVVPGWVQTIEGFAVAQQVCDFVVTSYSQLSKLIEEPTSVKNAKKQATKNRLIAKSGKSKYQWDYVIFDESHNLKNYPSSLVSIMASKISQQDKPYVKGKSTFTVFSTATPGSTPLHYSIMSKLVSPLLAHGDTMVAPDKWGQFLYEHGFAVTKGESGWRWVSASWFGKNSKDPVEREKHRLEQERVEKEQRKDVARIGRALSLPRAPFLMRSPQELEGFEEQPLYPLPLALEGEGRVIYNEAWSRFKAFWNLPGRREDPKARLVETLRYRQKASFIKCEQLANMIADMVEQGNQVYVSCFFGDSIEHLSELLEKKKVRVSQITGKSTKEEALQNRLDFQKGKTQVVITSIVEGINLQANEILPDGSRATSAPRISIIFDVRADPNKTVQALGRAHRNGEVSITYLPFFVGTVEKNDVDTFIQKWLNMATMTGDTQTREQVAQSFLN